MHERGRVRSLEGPKHSDGSEAWELRVFHLDGQLVSGSPSLTSDEEGRLGCAGERGDVLPGFARVGGAVHIEIVGECSHEGQAC